MGNRFSKTLDKFYASSTWLKKFTPVHLRCIFFQWMISSEMLEPKQASVETNEWLLLHRNRSDPCHFALLMGFVHFASSSFCVFQSALSHPHPQRTISRWWRSRGPLQVGPSAPRWRRPTGPPPCRPPGAWRHKGGRAGWPDAERQWPHRGSPAAGRCRSPLRNRWASVF